MADFPEYYEKHKNKMFSLHAEFNEFFIVGKQINNSNM